MDIVITVVAFLVVLGLLVLVHELGHFLTARLFKVRVEEFGFGFPPRLYPRPAVVERLKAQGKTVYSVNALPLGGFVRLAGENGVVTPGRGSSARPGDAPVREATAVTADDPGAFATKPAWQRAIVLVAGAVNNMALAMALVFLIFAVIGTPQTKVEKVQIVGVALHSPAARARIVPGDIVRSVDGRVPRDSADFKALTGVHPGRPVTLVLVRQGHTHTVQLVPRTSGIPCDQGPMGVITNPVDVHNVPVGAGQALGVALHVPVVMAQSIGGALVQLAAGQTQTGRLSPPGPSGCGYPSRYVTFGGQIGDALDVGTARGALQPDPCLSTSGSGSGLVGPIGIIRQVGYEAN
ncbi:MAG TPA: site-2 protease family protein, partial [Chloroflexota bacterium]|nr:site-2 protease family protein [Chloroflexota bacterium]